MRSVRAMAGVFLAVAVSGVFAAPAMAATPVATLDTDAPALTGDEGQERTVSIGLTNLTGDPVAVALAPDTKTTGCTLTRSPESVPPAQHVSITVTVPAACNAPNSVFGFSVEATAPRAPARTFAITTKAAEAKPKPHWSALYPFAYLLGGLMALALVAFLIRGHKLNEPLKYLDKAWSLDDSLVSNITVGVSVITGALGTSEVVKTFLGDKAESSLAVATVGSAIGAGLILAAGVVLLAFRAKGDDGYFTVPGLYAAAAVTMAGALGETFVIYDSSKRFEMGGVEDWVWIPALVLAALLVIYGARSVVQTVSVGTRTEAEEKTEEEKKKKEAEEKLKQSETLKAARIIAKAIREAGLRTALTRSLEEMQEVEEGESHAADETDEAANETNEALRLALEPTPTPPRRSALL
jgi:hypothetical protein